MRLRIHLKGLRSTVRARTIKTIENIPWFILSIDSKKLLYGYSVEADKDTFYTEDTTHIYIMEEYVLHDIVINRLISDQETDKRLTLMMKDVVENVKNKN